MRDGFLNGPLLHHVDFVVVALAVGDDGYGVHDGVLSGRHDGLDGIFAFHDKRHHDFVRLVVFVNLAEPVGGTNLVAGLGYWLEVPQFLFVEREVILAALQEHASELVKVVFQTVEILRQQTRAERNLKHVAGELHGVTHAQSAR